MYRSFCLLALFVLSAYAGSEESSAEWKAMKAEWRLTKEKCAEETGADLELWKKAHADKSIEVDRKMKCFGACLLKENEALDEHGNFNVEKAMEKLPQNLPQRDKILDAYTACAHEKGDDECETAHAIFTCIRDKKAFQRKGSDSSSSSSSSSEEE